MFEDWGLIEASFASQYGIRLRSDTEMSWDEFSTLLSGLMAKTPLGEIVSIRLETNKDMLKNFTPEQKKIHDDWQMKVMEEQRKIKDSTPESEKQKQTINLENIFKGLAGYKG